MKAKTKTKQTRGYILWRGVSPVDGRTPMCMVLVTKSKNQKTGRGMCQTYILREDMSPLDSRDEARNGSGIGDAANCFGCRHRQSTGGECYVKLFHGPRAVFDGLTRGIYPDVSADPKLRQHVIETRLAGRSLRIGTYGDPVIVPIDVWHAMANAATSHTGYTHQWFRPEYQAYSDLLMASVDTEDEARRASLIGWRYFRVRSSVSDPILGELVCPASAEFGKTKTCDNCTLCGGLSTPGVKSIAIVSHGFLTSRSVQRDAKTIGDQRNAKRVDNSLRSLVVSS